MAVFGTVMLALALAGAILTLFTGFLAGHTQNSRHAELSRLALYGTFGTIAAAAGALTYSFLVHDFSLAYVHGRSDVRMPLFYLVAALWGGQEGSLLLWALMSALFGAGAAWVNRDRLAETMPYFHGVMGLVLLGFLVVLNFVSPPFRSFVVIDTPLDGQGLNPLLQTPLMVIHPPCLLSGFATFAVPYAFGMAALLSGRLGNEWIRATRSWTLISWLFLSVGNILGGMWAYRELGWGGYWAWDAVENAALIPWFTGSAFLHSVIIQEQRGMLKRWNVVLVALTYLLTLLGTWMTRSGLIQSVHTFAESEVGNWFLGILLTMTAFTIGVIALRWKSLKADSRLEATASREGAFMLNNWAFLALAFVVLWGTLFPKFKEMATGEAIAIGPAWFNRMTWPLALALLVLMGLGTLLPWRRATRAALVRNFSLPTVATMLITPALALAYYQLRVVPLGVDPFTTGVAIGLVMTALVVFNLVTIVAEYVAGVRARMRTTQGGAVDALLSLLTRHRRRYGGYLVHIGVLMVLFAFVGNALKVETDATLTVGDTVELGDYVVHFDALDVEERTDRRDTVATMTLRNHSGTVTTLHPARFDYNDYAALRGGMPNMMKVTSEIYIHSTPLEDVYIALLNHDPERGAAAFKLVVLPFTWWFWFGGLVLIVGTLVAMWPANEPGVTPGFGGRFAAFAQVVLSVLVIAGAGGALATSRELYAQANLPPAAVGETAAEHAAHGDHEVSTADLTPEQRALYNEMSALVMTTCEGCAGKTLATASPSCAPSNVDRARIRELVAGGATRAELIALFVSERGEAALAIPPERGLNRLSWIVPSLGAAMALAGLIVLFRSWRRPEPGLSEAPSPEADAADAALLARFRDEVASSR